MGSNGLNHEGVWRSLISGLEESYFLQIVWIHVGCRNHGHFGPLCGLFLRIAPELWSMNCSTVQLGVHTVNFDWLAFRFHQHEHGVRSGKVCDRGAGATFKRCFQPGSLSRLGKAETTSSFQTGKNHQNTDLHGPVTKGVLSRCPSMFPPD